MSIRPRSAIAFFRTFLLAAVALCLLTALAFCVPAVAWYRRTKEKERADEQIRYLAHHDVMTGLDNRHRLTEKLQRALIALPAHGGKLALHYVDLDHFKDVNDTLGHDAGDTLIQLAAERLRVAARKKDVVARIGGDEFTVVQVDASDKSRSGGAGAARDRSCGSRSSSTATTVSIGASVGIAMAPARRHRHRATDALRRSRALQGQGGRPQLRPLLHVAARRRQPGTAHARSRRSATPSLTTASS